MSPEPKNFNLEEHIHRRSIRTTPNDQLELQMIIRQVEDYEQQMQRLVNLYLKGQDQILKRSVVSKQISMQHKLNDALNSFKKSLN